MKINDIFESTTSGSVASVAMPMGGTQKREGTLFKGKKTKKKFYESEVNEAEVNETDLILVPGQGKKLKPGFIPKDQDRRDHEVEMARSDLFHAAQNAKEVYKMIQQVSEDEGLEGWVQEKIIKANDYLNTVREYLEHKTYMQEGGVIAGGMSNFEESKERVDSLVTNALKRMEGPSINDAVKALIVEIGTQEFKSRLQFYKFYVNQMVQMYEEQGVAEGLGNFAKAIDNLHGWYQDDSSDPNIERYEFDDREGGYYAYGTIEHNLKTGEIAVDFEDKSGEYDGDIKATFNSIGDAMNALRRITTQHRYNTGKAQSFDRLGDRTLAGPDDVYKTDRAGKKGTLTKSRMDTMKMSSPYRKTGPKGVLPEQGVAEGWKGELAGGTIGGIAGHVAGSAVGGPIGGIIGGAVGGTGGGIIGRELTKEEQLNEIAPILAAGARLVITMAPKIAQVLKNTGKATAKAAAPVAKSGAEIAAKNADKIGVGLGAYEIGSSAADIAKAITAKVGTALEEKTIMELAQVAFKFAIPTGIVLAILYGGKKVIDSLFSNSNQQQGVAEGSYQSQYKSKEEAIQYAKQKVKTFRDPDDRIEIWSMPDGGFDVVHNMNSNGRNHCIDNGGKKLGTISPRQQGAAEDQVDEEKDACYNKVKSRYKVWPSAYASGALVKCRKVGASNWGNSSKK